MLAPRESATLAHELIAATCDDQQIIPGQLTLHADCGASMRSKPVAMLLADLEVTKSRRRPHVSDDNPYSESQFKTLKYRPDFPARFESIEHARAFCRSFVAWYNEDHRHSGLCYMTPAEMHSGQVQQCYAAPKDVLDLAYRLNPARFTQRHPAPPALPIAAGINWPNPLHEDILRTTISTLKSIQMMSHRADVSQGLIPSASC